MICINISSCLKYIFRKEFGSLLVSLNAHKIDFHQILSPSLTLSQYSFIPPHLLECIKSPLILSPFDDLFSPLFRPLYVSWVCVSVSRRFQTSCQTIPKNYTIIFGSSAVNGKRFLESNASTIRGTNFRLG